MVSKSIIFLVKSFFVNFYRHLAIFFWSHCPPPTRLHLSYVVSLYLLTISRLFYRSRRKSSWQYFFLGKSAWHVFSQEPFFSEKMFKTMWKIRFNLKSRTADNVKMEIFGNNFYTSCSLNIEKISSCIHRIFELIFSLYHYLKSLHNAR